MSYLLRNLIIVLISILAIGYWVYLGYTDNSGNNITSSKKLTNDTHLIFKLQDDYFFRADSTNPLNKLSSLIGINTISYKEDDHDFVSILRNQGTHEIDIGIIIPNTTSEFISLSYTKETLNNYKKYLQDQENTDNWDSINYYLNNNHRFNIDEFSELNSEIGTFKISNNHFFYIHSTEPYNTSSLLSYLEDSIIKIDSAKRIYKLIIPNLSELFVGNFFKTYKNPYCMSIENYFIFSEKIEYLDQIYISYINSNTLNKKKRYQEFIDKQYSQYCVNFYSELDKKLQNHKNNDKHSTTLIYQIIVKENYMRTNLDILYTDTELEKIITQSEDTINIDNQLDSSIIQNVSDERIDSLISDKSDSIIANIVKQTQDTQEKQDLGEIKYIIIEGESFRDATVKMKIKLEENGYEYNKIKIDHIFFYTNNGNTKLDWNSAVNKYLGKELPKPGDYFLMRKFYY